MPGNNGHPLSPLEIRVENGKILLIFQKSTKWVRLTPEMAEMIGNKLLEFSVVSQGCIILPPDGVTVQ